MPNVTRTEQHILHAMEKAKVERDAIDWSDMVKNNNNKAIWQRTTDELHRLRRLLDMVQADAHYEAQKQAQTQ